MVNNIILLLTTTFSIWALALVSTAFLLFSVFFKHSGDFTRFLHRLGFVYLIYYLWLESSGIILDFSSINSETYLEIGQEDSLFFRLFFLYSTFTLALFFFGVAERFFLSKRGRLEFPILLLFLHFGGLFALRLHTFIDLLRALERVTLTSYVLVTFERQNRFSTYAGVQYFILGSLPSARLLLSFGLFYRQAGSIALQDLDLFFNITYNTNTFMDNTDFKADFILNKQTGININDTLVYNLCTVEGFEYLSMQKIEQLIATRNPLNTLSIRALCFLFFNFFFKVTAAPFHVWAPSVYGKAPIASVTFLSIYSKVLIFFIISKLINSYLHIFSSITLLIFFFCGIMSLFVGRLGAFTEKLIKSFFVYSSIGHVGFLLISLGINTLEGTTARFTYLIVYVLSSFVIWFILLTLGRNKSYLTHFAELKNTDPVISLFFAFLIFSISGIPPLGGFFVKLDILAAILDTAHFFINYILFIFTVISFFYYLRLIKIIFFDTYDSSRSIISFSTTHTSEYPRHSGRIWLISIIIIILALYLCFMQKPLQRIQYDMLALHY